MVKVLMIDDDMRYLEILKIMLEDDGYEVHTATNGTELDKLIDLHEPDVVLMDVLMGTENGLVLAHDHRQKAMSSKTPFIFISAWTGVKDIPLPTNSLRLFKPFSHSELVRAVDQAVRRNTTLVT